MISRTRLLAVLLTLACLALGALPAAALAGSPAWQPVVTNSPTVLPTVQSAVQKIFVEAEGGTFKLSFWAAGGIGNLGAGFQVTNVQTTAGAFQVGQEFAAESVPAGTTILSCSPVCGVGATSLTLSKAFGLTGANRIELHGGPVATTPPLPYGASAAQVEAALNSLSTIGGVGGNVEVTGGPGGPGTAAVYSVAFRGSFSNHGAATITGDATSLSGANASVAVTPVVLGGAGTSELSLYAYNIGGAESIGDLTFKAKLPAGVTTTETPRLGGGNCTSGSGQTEFTCTLSAKKVQPSEYPEPIKVAITAAPGAESGIIQYEVQGGGAATASYEVPLTISSHPAGPGIEFFAAGAYDANGNPDTQAGDHPYSASAIIMNNTRRSPSSGLVFLAGEPKDISVNLPPGFLGNPLAVPACPESTEVVNCPTTTMVGTTRVFLVPGGAGVGGLNSPQSSVYNTEAPLGYPGKFRFLVLGTEPVGVTAKLRSDEDYGITTSSINTAQIKQVFGTFFTFWGQPADDSHGALRCQYGNFFGTCEPHSTLTPTSFLTNATNCSEQASIAAANSGGIPVKFNVTFWQNPGEAFTGSAGVPPVTGCDKLHFEDNFTFEPSATKSDSTASFKTSLTVPSEGLTGVTCEKLPGHPEPCLTTPELKDMTVQLPKGVVLNASGADGLQACSLEQIGYLGNEFPMPNPIRFNKDPQTCPEASKIGTGELKTALLEDPLHGALYLAAQGKANPFGSLFAIYLVIEDPRHGIFIKLPGEVEPSETDGQMQVTFTNLPQLPFTRLDLSLKGGNRSALASPTTCGQYTTTAIGTPWSAPESGPPTESSNGFEINQGPNGLPCAKTPQERPFDIGWKAGAEGNQAGASSPFSFQITRPDGSQEIDTLDLTTPPGLSASLKGVPYCSEAQIKQAEQSTGKQELANPACPGASQVGRLEVGSGPGPSPFYTGGKLYLAGPYKGAPISVVSVVPAVAGPFDLGNVVSRNALFINRQTAQVTAKSDPIPQILKGVVLRIRDIRIFLNHKDWTLNPTNCEPSSVGLTIHGNSGATAERSARFQVGGCDKLNFAPKLTARVTGPTKRGELPAFTAELTYPEGPGYANIKDVQVALPHSEFLEQAHINTICTRVQAAAHQCPQGSIYGYAEATTPLIDGVLKGPVFLKSSDHKLPDLAIALRGPDSQPVEVEFAGRIDSVHGQIRNTIEGLPDVPVSKFVLRMKGGRKGLLVNSRNLCQGKPGRMTVNMVAQNNKTSDSRPLLGNSCGAKKHKKAKKHHKRHRLSRLIAGW